MLALISNVEVLSLFQSLSFPVSLSSLLAYIKRPKLRRTIQLCVTVNTCCQQFEDLVSLNNNMAQSGPCKKGRKVSEGKDIISNLPESILGHILSFLPTKDAVLTSVLSKKWIYMWTFITNLHLDDSVLYYQKKTKKEYFVSFVNRVLLHLTNSTLQSFSLIASSSYDYCSCFVNTWISAVLKRKVQKLHIDYSGKIMLSSHSLFECKSLVELKLKLPKCTLKIPASVSLPNLKFLSLSSVTLMSDADSSTHPKELILSFPVLKVFTAKRCKWSMQNVCLRLPLLEMLMFSAADIGSSMSMSSALAIKICTLRPKMFSFKGGGDLLKDIVLLDPSSASNAFFEISGRVRFSSRVCMLLKQFNQMRYLKLGNIQIPNQAKDDFANLPEFRNVCQLKIGTVSGDTLLGLLHKLPILKILVLNSVLSKFDKEVLNSATVPHCLVSSLKVVKFGVLDGEEHELCLAKFLIENGAALKQMSFSFSKTLQNGSSKIAMEEIKRQLLSFRKCSSFGFIEFSTV